MFLRKGRDPAVSRLAEALAAGLGWDPASGYGPSPAAVAAWFLDNHDRLRD